MRLFKNHAFRRVVIETNIFDAAIGFAVAVGFVSLVNSFVSHVLSLPLGAFIKGKSLSTFEWNITFLPGQEPLVFRYGLFLDACIEFFLITFTVYWFARFILRIKKNGYKKINQHNIKLCKTCCMEIPSQAKKCPFCQTDFLSLE